MKKQDKNANIDDQFQKEAFSESSKSNNTDNEPNSEKAKDDQLHQEAKDIIENLKTGSYKDSPDYIKQQKIIEDLSSQNTMLKDRVLRQAADAENIRKRGQKLLDTAKESSIFEFAKDMTSVSDQFSSALGHIPENLNDEAKNIIEGVKMTKKELYSVFTKHSLKTIEPQPNDKFDFNIHHAISQTATDKQEPGTIVSTMQIGYKIKDRLIRPAIVSVAKKAD